MWVCNLAIPTAWETHVSVCVSDAIKNWMKLGNLYTVAIFFMKNDYGNSIWIYFFIRFIDTKHKYRREKKIQRNIYKIIFLTKAYFSNKEALIIKIKMLPP